MKGKVAMFETVRVKITRKAWEKIQVSGLTLIVGDSDSFLKEQWDRLGKWKEG